MREADILKAAALIQRRIHGESRIKELNKFSEDGSTNHYITLNGTNANKTTSKIFRELSPEDTKQLTDFLITIEEKYIGGIQADLYNINCA